VGKFTHSLIFLADSGVLKDEEIVLQYTKNRELRHRSRQIAHWESENLRLFEFITNKVGSRKDRIDTQKMPVDRTAVQATETELSVKYELNNLFGEIKFV
jgi:hypothetical protein